VESIAKITVTKGASSLLYGANTMGGVINIVTKKGSRKRSTESSVSFGDYATQNYAMNHGGMLGKLNYWLAGSHRISDGFRLSSDFDKENEWTGQNSEYHEDGHRRDLSDYRKQSVNAKLGYEPGRDDRLYLSFGYHRNERGCPVEYNRYWSFSNWNQWRLNLVGQKKIGHFVTIKGKGFYMDYDDELVDDAERTVASGGKSWFDKSVYDDYSIGGELHSYFNFGRLSILKVGFNCIEDQNKQREYNAKNRKGEIIVPGWGDTETCEARTYAIAVEDEIKPVDRLAFVLGLSYGYFDPIKSADVPTPNDIGTVDPQAGVIFSLTDYADIHASVGKKTRFPHLKELYSKHTGGNPDLKPQRTVTCEVGGTSRYRLGNSMKARASVFHNDIKDLIQEIKDDEGNKMYVNVGSATIMGAEAGLDIEVSRNLSFELNHTHLLATDEDNDRYLEGRPRYKSSLDSRYRLPFGSSVSFQSAYVAEQYTYLISLFGSSSELFVSVNNITDENYDEGSGPMRGRSFLAGVTLRIN
jgi:iron complex outermembrane receptor protein/outer membrane receptor for ferrienterochelin and colicins